MFDRVYCINLSRRDDRLIEFYARLPEDWPFAGVQRYNAIDGKRCNCPSWFTGGGGAWGCYRSHLRIIERCLNDGIDSVLLLEDDAICCDKFSEVWSNYLVNLPQDWGMLYLGGQHLNTNAHPPRKINEYWYQANNVNRTHAFALRGNTMRAVYKWLCETGQGGWQRSHHIDHHLGRFHHEQYMQGRNAQHKVYSPAQWLIGQAEGKSNVSGRELPERYWPSAASVAPEYEKPFVAVLGLHRSGSSCLAMCLHFLGVHMGNVLTGYEKHNGGGGEAVQLAKICEQILPFPTTQKRWDDETIVARLRRWTNERRKEAHVRGCIAGGKYPTLCDLAPQLEQACGGADMLQVVHIDRPIEESIASLQRRADGFRATEQERTRIQWYLYDRKREYLESRNVAYLTVQYADLCANPRRELERVLEYLQIDKTSIHKLQWQTAIEHVKTREQIPCQTLAAV